MKYGIKNLVKAAIIFAASSVANTAHAQGNLTLAINVGNLQSTDGQILVSVCTKDQFMKSKCAYSARVSAQSAEDNAIIINDVAPGTYAVQMFHDIDNDNNLKTGMFGIPKEPWGMSNDAKGKFGPPKFEDAAITLNQNTEININLDGGE